MQRYLDIYIPCKPETQELLSAELFEIGFEGVWEQDAGLHAYIPVNDFSNENLNDLLVKYQISEEGFTITNMDEVNWNEEWEKSYEAIEVDGRCIIRAEFHPARPDLEYDIVIQPKMSFGTGHHDSTHMIVKLMLDLDFSGKTVLDVGCGTGVLAILAGLKGAGNIVALDNNPWSVENTLENAERNGVKMTVLESGIEEYNGPKYDFILSNITRNINHFNIPRYAGMMQPGGQLILSGFFERDFDYLNDQAIKHGFQLLNKAVSDKTWLALHYTYQGS